MASYTAAAIINRASALRGPRTEDQHRSFARAAHAAFGRHADPDVGDRLPPAAIPGYWHPVWSVLPAWYMVIGRASESR